MPPIPARELTPGYQQRYSNTATSPHGGFHVGMIRDLPSWELPPGACYDAADMLCDLEAWPPHLHAD